MNKIIKKIVTIISPLLLLTLNILGSTFVSSSLHNLADKQYRQVTLSNKITRDNMVNSDILTNFGALPLDGNDEANFFPTDFIVKNLKRRFQQEIDITKIELFGLPNKELSDAGINKVIILQNKENLKDYNIDPTTIEFKKYQLFTSDKIVPNLTYIYPLEKLNLPLIDKDNNEYLHYAFIAPAAGGESWYSQFITYNSLDLQVDLNFKKPIQTESQKILTTFRSGELKDYEKLDVTDKIEEYLCLISETSLTNSLGLIFLLLSTFFLLLLETLNLTYKFYSHKYRYFVLLGVSLITIVPSLIMLLINYSLPFLVLSLSYSFISILIGLTYSLLSKNYTKRV